MPRGSEKPIGGPYRIWTAKVEDQNRVRVSLAEISEIVTWIGKSSGTIECFGIPGAVGGVQLQPVEVVEDLQEPFLEALGAHNVSASDAGEMWVDTARLFASKWPTTISIESNRISITLPEPARRSLQLPAVGEIAVIFGFGSILEIWIASHWYDYIHRLSRDRIPLMSRSIESLQS